MDNTNERPTHKVPQFRDLSEADARVLDRMVVDRQAPRSPNRQVDMQAVGAIFKRTLRDTSDIRNIFKAMPDLNLPREMLVSAICAPGDLANTSLIMSNGIGGATNQLTSALVDALDQFFVKEQGMAQKVPEWVDDALIMSGAHPMLIIPEASLDRMIHGTGDHMSLESVSSFDGEFHNGWFTPKGFLGLQVPTAQAHGYISMESARVSVNGAQMAEYHTIKVGMKSRPTQKVPLPYKVTDNMACLRQPAVQQAKRARVMERAFGTLTLESRRRDRKAKSDDKKVGSGEVYSKYFKPPQGLKRSRLEVIPTLKQSGGKTYGHPMVYHLPIESVMPVCVPGDETNHVGYIVILDQNGYPVSFSRRLDYYEDIRRSAASGDVGSAGSVSGELLQQAGETLSGGFTRLNDGQLDRLAALHADIIDADLIARLKAGMMSGDFEITRSEHVDRLMFSRTLKNQQTTMLYVPAELMVYMAYDYNEFGVGRSILEDAKTLAAYRSALMTANVIGSARNAIPGKNINIKLDPDDADPVATATFMASEAISLLYHEFPTTITTPQGMAEKLQISGMSVNVSGNPRYPEVETTVSERESTGRPVDQALLESLRDDLTRVFSFTPEMVDGSNQPDFATTIVRNSLMLLKRVMVIQGKTNPQLADYVRIFTMNSGILIEHLLEIIEHNKKYLPDDYKERPEDFLEEFLNCLQVKLPAPENESMIKQLEQFDAYSDGLDKLIASYMKDEYLDGYATEVDRAAMPTMIASWKGVMLRKFMRDRGMFRDLDIFGNNEDGSPIMDMEREMTGHVEAMKNAFGSYATKTAKDAIARKVENERIRLLTEKAKASMEPPVAVVEETAAPADTTGGDDELGGDGTNDDTGDGDAIPGVDDEGLGDDTPAETEGTDTSADTPVEGTDTPAEPEGEDDDTGAPPAGGPGF